MLEVLEPGGAGAVDGAGGPGRGWRRGRGRRAGGAGTTARPARAASTPIAAQVGEGAAVDRLGVGLDADLGALGQVRPDGVHQARAAGAGASAWGCRRPGRPCPARPRPGPSRSQLAAQGLQVGVAAVERAHVDDEGAVAAARRRRRAGARRGGGTGLTCRSRPSSPICSTDRKASWGTSTEPDLLHALLALLLALQQLALAADVAAVALGQHVLALGLHGLAGEDLAADRRLDRHVEELAGDGREEPLHQGLAAGCRPGRGGRSSTARPPCRRPAACRASPAGSRGSRRSRSRARRSRGCGSSAGRRSRARSRPAAGRRRSAAGSRSAPS